MFNSLIQSQFPVVARVVDEGGQPAASTVDPDTAATILEAAFSEMCGLAAHYSGLASANANQVEPFAYFRALLVPLSGHPQPAAAALPPDAWLKAHPKRGQKTGRVA